MLQNISPEQKSKLQQHKASKNATVHYHGHCHQKAMHLSSKTKQLLELVAHVKLIISGCCGMAGSFGYEKENYDLSMKISQDRFIPELKKCNSNPILLPGRSCREMALRHEIQGQHPIIWFRDFINSLRKET